MAGAKTWYFPDGYLPEKLGNSRIEAREALMLLNINTKPVEVLLDFFEDRDPVLGVPITIGAERVLCLRMDKAPEFGSPAIRALVPYALRVRLDREIIAQFGRLDATQDNLAYYSSMGFND
ncbi:MAG: hypothetical protein GXY52_05085 [Chloroflexi bacterium]|nr:hypothetical protein [Chloroflexota bacterium]